MTFYPFSDYTSWWETYTDILWAEVIAFSVYGKSRCARSQIRNDLISFSMWPQNRLKRTLWACGESSTVPPNYWPCDAVVRAWPQAVTALGFVRPADPETVMPSYHGSHVSRDYYNAFKTSFGFFLSGQYHFLSKGALVSFLDRVPLAKSYLTVPQMKRVLL